MEKWTQRVHGYRGAPVRFQNAIRINQNLLPVRAKGEAGLGDSTFPGTMAVPSPLPIPVAGSGSAAPIPTPVVPAPDPGQLRFPGPDPQLRFPESYGTFPGSLHYCS